LYAPHIRPVPGIIEFLENVKKVGIPCALATSSPSVNVHFVLEKTRTQGFFSVVCDASSITRGKPHPDIFIAAAGKLGVSPEHCVIFEDSLNGIEAAQRSGARVVAVLTTHKANELPPVDMVLENFENLELHRLQNLF
jgi:HAD superfamily hydrolase (TIGR01509 family)